MTSSADPGPSTSAPGEGARSSTPPYEIDARTEGNGVSRVTGRAASPLTVDTSAGQSPESFGPAELLAAAFAACSLKNVERFSHLLPFRYSGATMHVVAERTDGPPRIADPRYVLRLTTDEPPQRVDLLRRNLVKFGTVYNTLARSVEIHGEIEVEPPPSSGRSPPDARGPGSRESEGP